MPRVSILFPVHNGGRYLPAALDSVINQTFEDWELIAIDDGSSDHSLAILERYADGDRRIRVISQPNKGLVPTLNKGIALCDSPLLARMDADDICYPTRLRRQVDFLDEQPGVGLCGTWYDQLSSRGRLSRIENVPFTNRRDLEILSWFFCVLKHPTTMFHRDRLSRQHLVYDERYIHAEDFDLFRRIAAGSEIGLIEEPLLAYRVHSQSVSVSKAEVQSRTHIRIVTENLAAQGIEVDGVRLLELTTKPQQVSVACAAGLIRQLDERARELGRDHQRAFRFGTLNLFYFFYAVLYHVADTRLLETYVRLSGKADMIRKAENWSLRTFSSWPLLTRMCLDASQNLLWLRQYLESRPIRPGDYSVRVEP